MTTAHDQIRLRRMSDAELETAIAATGLLTIGGDWAALKQRHLDETGGGTSCYDAAIADTDIDPLFWLRDNHPQHAATFDEAARRWPDRRVLFVDWGTNPGADYYLEATFTERVTIRIGEDIQFDAIVTPDVARRLLEESRRRDLRHWQAGLRRQVASA